MLKYNQALSIAEQAYFIKKNYLARPSFSSKFILYRLIRPFLKFAYHRFIKKIPNAPWVTPAAIRIFEEMLTHQLVGFEFGSGRSTLFLAQRVNHLTSLEHEPEWHTQITSLLLSNQISNVDYHLIQKEATNKPFLPRRREDDLIIPYTPATCFRSYYTYIDRYPDDYFDFIIVDGRARVECTQHAVRKLKSGGMLILDNSERKRYQPIHELLASWPKVYTTTGLTDTTFWFKPSP